MLIPPVVGNGHSLLASELFALANGAHCDGGEVCHWCSAPCSRLWFHDDPPPSVIAPGVLKAYRQACKRPGSPYLCVGCWLWRHTRVTISFLGGGYKDGQCPCNWGWWITPTSAWGLGPESGKHLYPLLLKPPLRCALLLRDDGRNNCLQHGVANEFEEVRADTVVRFTINNSEHSYTVGELEETLRTGGLGREPGARELVKLLGPWVPPPTRDLLREESLKVNKKGGRPKPLEDGRQSKKVVQMMAASGGQGG